MSEHTKTPWKIGRYGKIQAEGMASWDSINVSGFSLCNWEEAEANARHIVKCVNNHDRLVEALRNLLSRVENDADSKIWFLSEQESARDLLAELERQS